MADTPIYIVDPIEVDETVLEQSVYDFIQSQFPDWVPNDSNLEVWLAAAFSRIAAETAEVAADVPPAILRYVGTLFGENPTSALPASVASTWTFVDNPAGRTIDAGTLVSIEDADGNPVAFEVLTDVTVASPALTTAVGEVILQATVAGAEFDGLGGVGVVVAPIDNVDWVDTVTLTGATSDGADAETDSDYLDRLSARLTLLSTAPILPGDYEVAARYYARREGIDVRVLVLDGYNPGTATYGNEGDVTLVMANAATGAALPVGIRDLILATIQASVIVNTTVYAVDPTYTTVDVDFVIATLPGVDGATAVQDVVDSLTNYLASANWGKNSSQQGMAWNQADTLRRQEISTVIDSTIGVDHWETITIGLNGGVQTTADSFALSGAAPLTVPGSIVGTAI